MSREELYDHRAVAYDAFIWLARHRRAVRRYFVMHSELLSNGDRVLDAGCGTGALIEALQTAIATRSLSRVQIDAYDISGRMLERSRKRLGPGVGAVRLLEADVLSLDRDLPQAWLNYDLIVSSGMLEYVRPDQLSRALGNLRDRTAVNGKIVVFISRDTRRNRLFIGTLWRANLYTETALRERFAQAGLKIGSLEPFERWGFVVIATR